VPFKEEIRWLSERDGYVVGDLGCGEAFIAAEAGDKHTIHSFDHVAIDKRVTSAKRTAASTSTAISRSGRPRATSMTSRGSPPRSPSSTST